MRHVVLTCKNHPYLRWNCKSIAFTPGRGYNQQRHIFWIGMKPGAQLPSDITHKEQIVECSCPPTDLILAPEDPWASLSEAEQREAIKND